MTCLFPLWRTVRSISKWIPAQWADPTRLRYRHAAENLTVYGRGRAAPASLFLFQDPEHRPRQKIQGLPGNHCRDSAFAERQERGKVQAEVTYNSRPDTEDHRGKVSELIYQIIHDLERRSFEHDASKLQTPEKSIFDEYTPRLKGSTYGSDEYKQYLSEMKVALDHHYSQNRHHPEHFSNGINDMNLVDLIEMLCDWKAATLRHADGDILRSVRINRERFEISEQLAEILVNTVRALGWDEPQ